MRQKIGFPGTNKAGWGIEVAYYRLYRLAEPGGKFVGFEEIEAVDDVEAARLAEVHCGPQALELWCGNRKIRTFAPLEGDAAPTT
jgi:hypothetical protein